MPHISIIVPVYNAEQYINTCINSIIEQSYIDWELLLVDDGSTDSSGDICDDYAKNDNRIKVFHKENGGVSCARNYGLDHAKGEWIAFVDADDWLDKYYLEHFIENINADIIVAGYNYTDGTRVNQNTLEQKKTSVLDINYNSEEGKSLLFFPWAKLYRRNIINENNLRFNKNMRMAEDTCFTMAYLGFCDSVSFIPSTSYYYRCPTIISKYNFSFNELRSHVDALTASTLTLTEKCGLDLEQFKKGMITIFFFNYKNYICSLTPYSNYYKETSIWNYKDFCSLISMVNCSIIQKLLYLLIITFPRFGFVYAKSKRA